jgi:NAD(P) transhydrogenase subunit alpha
MKIGIPKEIHPGEKRVATTPEVATQLQKLGFSVAVEAGAGAAANFSDAAFAAAGVEVVGDTQSLWSGSDIILKVRPPERHPALARDEAELLREGQILISFIWPAQNRTACRGSPGPRSWMP